MAVETAIAFATLLLEDNHVFTFHEGSLHLANNLCALYGRSAYLHCAVSVNQENLVTSSSDFLGRLITRDQAGKDTARLKYFSLARTIRRQLWALCEQVHFLWT